MYICPTCKKEFDSETKIIQHSLQCWKKANPHIKSKPIEHSDDVVIREENDELKNFLNSFKKEN